MTATAQPLTAEVLRAAFACFPSGVTAVCSLVDGRPVGMAASSFTSVSLDPPLVSVCVARSSTTWPVLRAAGRVGVSVLAADHGPTCRALAGRAADRFADVPWVATGSGAVLVEGASLWLDCEVHDELPAGDHEIVLLRITAVHPRPEVPPLVFHGSRFTALAG